MKRRKAHNFKLRIKRSGKLMTRGQLRKHLAKRLHGKKLSSAVKKQWARAAKYHGKKLVTRTHAVKKHGKKAAKSHAKRHGKKHGKKAAKKAAKKTSKKRGKRKGKLSPKIAARAKIMKKIWAKGSASRAKLMKIKSPKARFKAAAKMVNSLAKAAN